MTLMTRSSHRLLAVPVLAAALAASVVGAAPSAVSAATPTVAAPCYSNAVVTVSPAFATVGKKVTFNASKTTLNPGCTIAKYAWTFGDGGKATGVKVTHVYKKTGLSKKWALTVTNSGGNVQKSAYLYLTSPVSVMAAGKCVVPKLVGKTYLVAEAKLIKAGCAFGTPKYVFNVKKKSGTVKSTSPKSSSKKYAHGKVVTLSVWVAGG